MGIFGWSYPPGCSSVPGDEPDPPCALCGEDPDVCKCPECPECGEIGCVEHLENTELVQRFQAASYIAEMLKQEIDKRDRERATPCPKCGEPVVPCMVTGDPLYCQNCKIGELDQEWYDALENPNDEG